VYFQFDDINNLLSKIDENDVDNIFKDDIIVSEVKYVCEKKLKLGKTSDHYGVQNEHFKYAGDEFYRVL
jgi:hypothetical protein